MLQGLSLSVAKTEGTTVCEGIWEADFTDTWVNVLLCLICSFASYAEDSGAGVEAGEAAAG